MPEAKPRRVISTFKDQPGREFWRGDPRNPVLDPEVAHAMALAEAREIETRAILEARYIGQLATARELFGDDAAENKPPVKQLRDKLNVPLQQLRDAAAEKARSSHAINSFENTANAYHLDEIVRIPVEPLISSPVEEASQPSMPTAVEQQPEQQA